MNVHITGIIRGNMAEVLAIEAESFDDPWGMEDFIQALRPSRHHAQVALCDDRVVGYMVYANRQNCIDMLNFAVHHDFRRQGVGRQMIARLKAKLSKDSRSRIIERVNGKNLRAQLFWKAMGFRAVALQRNGLGPGIDAIIMMYHYEQKNPFHLANRIGCYYEKEERI